MNSASSSAGSAGGTATIRLTVAQAVVKFLAERPEVRDRYFDANVSRARVSYSLSELPVALDETFSAHGWISW